MLRRQVNVHACSGRRFLLGILWQDVVHGKAGCCNRRSNSNNSTNSNSNSSAVQSLRELVHHEAVIRKSRFVVTAAPAFTEAEAKDVIQQHRDPGATHNCWAYVVASGVARCSDDGEVGGTAGPPMLSALQNMGLEAAVVLCTRYYGGVKLGTGGLVRAYGGSTREALLCAEVVAVPKLVLATVTTPAALYAEVHAATGQLGCTMVGSPQWSTDAATVSCSVQAEERLLPLLEETLQQRTRGQASVEVDPAS